MTDKEKKAEAPRLWWFVCTEERKFEYRLATLDELVGDFNECRIRDYTVVHPENLLYEEELRNYNAQYIDYIRQGYCNQLRKLIELKAPDCVLAEESNGVFSKSKNLLG